MHIIHYITEDGTDVYQKWVDTLRDSRVSKPYISHEEATIESFRKAPDYAAEYLNAVLEDGDQEELMLALRRIASAFGIKDVAQTAHLNPKTLYRTLSPTGNPELRSFQAILGAMGMRLAVTPLAMGQHQQ